MSSIGIKSQKQPPFTLPNSVHWQEGDEVKGIPRETDGTGCECPKQTSLRLTVEAADHTLVGLSAQTFCTATIVTLDPSSNVDYKRN